MKLLDINSMEAGGLLVVVEVNIFEIDTMCSVYDKQSRFT